MRNIEDRFTVKYYLNLVIADVDDNKYFKQQVSAFYWLEEEIWSTGHGGEKKREKEEEETLQQHLLSENSSSYMSYFRLTSFYKYRCW